MEAMHPLFKIARLIAKEKTSNLSDQENITLQQWIAESEQNRALYDKLKDKNELSSIIDELKNFNSQKAYKKVIKEIEKTEQKTGVLEFVPNYLKYAAAITLFIVASYFVNKTIFHPKVTSIAQSKFVPGKQKAILITSSNKQIELDSSSIKQIQTGENTVIAQNGSTLSYSSDSISNISKEIAYNTLITPLGGEYTLILSDGTEVMLNAGSSLKYPVVFNSNIREVELEGEAFFKVAKSKTIPFQVHTSQIKTVVYGTEFNISEYNNDETVQTTLVEGSVGVTLNIGKPGMETKLVPGQQFNYNKTAGVSQTRNVNTEQYIAWTKGMFVFENEPIENILKSLSRWYKFDYEFTEEKQKIQRFTINIGRYDHISKILDLISISSGLKFKATDNKVIVYTE
jgi:ferric-dicitrate binding protein FerR (iron transport regulator)